MDTSLDGLKRLASKRFKIALRLWHLVMVVMVVVWLSSLRIVETESRGTPVDAVRGSARASSQSSFGLSGLHVELIISGIEAALSFMTNGWVWVKVAGGSGFGGVVVAVSIIGVVRATRLGGHS